MAGNALVLAAVALGLAAFADDRAAAQTYPDKPIKIIVPAARRPDRRSGAAGVADPAAELGQPVVVENRPGAGGAIGARAVASRRRTAIRCSPATPACSR